MNSENSDEEKGWDMNEAGVRGTDRHARSRHAARFNMLAYFATVVALCIWSAVVLCWLLPSALLQNEDNNNVVDGPVHVTVRGKSVVFDSTLYSRAFLDPNYMRQPTRPRLTPTLPTTSLITTVTANKHKSKLKHKTNNALDVGSTFSPQVTFLLGIGGDTTDYVSRIESAINTLARLRTNSTVSFDVLIVACTSTPGIHSLMEGSRLPSWVRVYTSACTPATLTGASVLLTGARAAHSTHVMLLYPLEAFFFSGDEFLLDARLLTELYHTAAYNGRTVVSPVLLRASNPAYVLSAGLDVAPVDSRRFELYSRLGGLPAAYLNRTARHGSLVHVDNVFAGSLTGSISLRRLWTESFYMPYLVSEEARAAAQLIVEARQRGAAFAVYPGYHMTLPTSAPGSSSSLEAVDALLETPDTYRFARKYARGRVRYTAAPVAWDISCECGSEYRREAEAVLTALEPYAYLAVPQNKDCSCSTGLFHAQAAVRRMRGRYAKDGLVWVSHAPPSAYADVLHFLKTRPQQIVGRSGMPFQSVPNAWRFPLSFAAQVWVPTYALRSLLVEAGLSPRSVRYVPTPVDPALYDPARTAPLAYITETAPSEQHFRFLSILDFDARDGYDVLLEAYFSAFTRADPVVLFLQVTTPGATTAKIVAAVAAFAKNVMGKNADELPPVRVFVGALDEATRPRLFSSADAFVLPARAQDFCASVLEAMAMGLPTAATAFGACGHIVAHASLSYPIAVKGFSKPSPASFPQGYQVPEDALLPDPSPEDTAAQLRKIYNNRDKHKTVAAATRAAILAEHSTEVVAKLITDNLADLDLSNIIDYN